MSTFGSPVLVTSGSARPLERIPLAKAGGGSFDEQWLQRTLFEHPECLPLDDLHPGSPPLIPICMELRTEMGFVDILYLTSAGGIVLVETKLFRNPEARREVIAQVIEYAKDLSSWTYEDLARQFAVATKRPATDLIAVMQKACPGLDEARFIDSVTLSLQTADMMLLIVGDGIRSSLESLVAFLDRYATLRYSLALVEVGVFRVAEDQLLVQPRILANTKILTRQVFVGGGLAGQQDQETPGPTPTPGKPAQGDWLFAFWQEFARRVKLDDTEQPLPRPLRIPNIYFPMPPSERDAWVSAFISRAQGFAGVYVGFGGRYEQAADVYAQLLEERTEIEEDLGEPVVWPEPIFGEEAVITVQFRLPIGDLDNQDERRRVQDILARVSNRFVNAFRHRLEALADN